MYKQIENTAVLTELNSGAQLYVVDVATKRVMACSDLTMGAILSFIDNTEIMFFEALANE